LNVRGEFPAATGPMRETTDSAEIVDFAGPRWGPPQGLGSASSGAVVKAVCSSLASGPSVCSRGKILQPSQASFSYVPPRHYLQAFSPR
jgi:hypothetical protein